MLRCVGVFLRGNSFFIEAISHTIDGIGVTEDVRLSVPCTAADDALADAILEQLARSRTGILGPPPSSDLVKSLLKIANVKSWRQFVEGARFAEVEDDGVVFTIVPFRNLGAKDGFRPVHERAARIPADARHELGAATRAILASED